jgi:sulfane dehydrogenase subunit SoxC
LGNGRISKVVVSADGGKSWATALQGRSTPGVHPLPHAVALTVSRWCCKPRCDEAARCCCAPSSWRAGTVEKRCQPVAFPNQHYNSITSWGSTARGLHVYA